MPPRRIEVGLWLQGEAGRYALTVAYSDPVWVGFTAGGITILTSEEPREVLQWRWTNVQWWRCDASLWPRVFDDREGAINLADEVAAALEGGEYEERS